MGRGAAAIAILLLLAGCAAAPVPEDPNVPQPGPAPEQGPPPAGGPILSLPLVPAASGTRVSGGAEPSILADRNGKYLWVGDTAGGHISTDNGTTWRRMAPLALGVHAFSDGWGLAQDEDGNLYAADLSENHVDIGRSSDGGSTWNQVSYLAGVSGTADRPWIAASKGHVVLFYFDAPAVATGLFEHCARSTDGGRTFTDRHPAAGLPQGGKAFYDSQGRFYYSQSDGILYRFAGSCLGGATRIPMLANAGVNNMVQADVEGTDLYMAGATDRSSVIILAGSHDGGPTKSLVVSPPELKSNTFATLSVHQGQVAVAWYGSTTSGDPSAAGFSGDWNVYLSVIDDFWGDPVVRTELVSAQPNHRGFICMGGIGCTGGRGLLDYFMVDHDKWGGIHVAYTDDASGPAGVVHVHVPPAPRGEGSSTPQPGKPLAAFSVSVAGLEAKVDASGSAASDGSALEYAWEWGDGAVGSGATAAHTYAAAGEYRIRLTVTEASGAKAEATRKVRLDGAAAPPPVAGLSFLPAAPRAGQQVTFKDASAGTGIARWSWDFGDGGKAEGATAQHTFAKEGNYLVRLTVTDGAGQVDDHATAVKVLPAPGTDPKQAAAPPKGTPGPGALALVAAIGAAALLASRRR